MGERGGDRLAGGGVPHAGRAIVAGGGNALAVAREACDRDTCVVAEDDCTIWIPDGWSAEVAVDGSYVLTR